MAGPQIIYRVAAHLGTKGDLAGAMKSKAAAVSGLGASLDQAAAKAQAWGASQVSAVAGAGMQIAKFSAATAGAGAGAAAAFVAKKGLESNISFEKTQNTIAGTLQLYNHSAGAADQLGQNIKVAGAAMLELNRIADAAPGELADITLMFQNMLPGARSVTGEMSRIMAMSQNLALFTPTLTGGDFITSGAQMSRILTGSAAAEMDTWKRLAPVVLSVGKEMDKISGSGKVFGKDINEDFEKMTIAFNKLDAETRFRLIEESFKRGGPALAKMYETSFEGASSSFITGWRKIAAESTRPMYNSLKAALIKANGEGGAFSKENLAKLMTGASKIGGVLNRSFSRVLDAGARGIEYLANHWDLIANKVYHAMQIGAGLIKAAFAFGVARMLVGAGVLAASTAARAGIGAAKMGMGAVSGVAKLIEVMGSVTAAWVVMLPMMAVASVAIVALGGVLVAAAGVAAYLAANWRELTASIAQGFRTGEITLRPVVLAAMILWEKLKAVGEAFLGGVTGASMMQGAINMIAEGISMVTDGVVLMIDAAAGFLEMAANVASFFDGIFSSGRHLVLAGLQQEKNRLIAAGDSSFNPSKRMEEIDARIEALDPELRPSMISRARDVASGLRKASAAMSDGRLKDINFGDVDDLTAKVDKMAKDLFSGDTETKKKPKGPSINIGTLVQQFDLRNEDPDRAMVAWVEPIERIARQPGGSSLDIGGF